MSLHFLCPPLPEEWVYSLAARTGRAVGIKSSRSVVQKVFGAHKASLGLALVANDTGHGERFVPHTLFHFATAFIFPRAKVAAISEAMESRDYLKVGYQMGRAGARRLKAPSLRYCSACAREQRREHGVAYWCRLPQINGIMGCPKHKLAFTSPEQSRRDRNELICLDEIMKVSKGGRQRRLTKVEASVASLAASLLDFEGGWNAMALRGAWEVLFRRHGISRYSRGAAKHVIAGLRERFGDTYLRDAGCDLGLAPDQSWVARFLRHPTKEHDALRHILILDLFGATMADLIDGARAGIFVHPLVKESELTCGNSVCPAQAGEWHGQTRVFRCGHSRRQLLHYTCQACGQTRGRVLAEGREWIVDHGEIWRTRLKELWSDFGKSLRSIASVLGVDPLTVKRQASKEGLTFPRLGKRVTNAEQKPEVKAKNPETERAKRRAIWLSVTARISATSAARKAEPAAYAWLRRNDQDWLAEHLPTTPKIKNVSRINWSSLEQELLARLRRAHLAIINRVPFVQCTLPALLYRMRSHAMGEHLDKMPELAEMLGRLVENEALFRLRRIATVCEQTKGTLSTEQVLEQAGIDRAYARLPGVIAYVSEKLGDRKI